MLQARKEALENTLRQRLVAIRERELNYYTNNCRNTGNQVWARACGHPPARHASWSITPTRPDSCLQSAVISGLAYSGIRYHYLLERQHNYQRSTGDSLEECVFLSLLSVTLGCSLQTIFVSMLVALLGPQLALRGPEGSLHDAVEGMHRWNSVILALFMTSLFLLQLSAFSLMCVWPTAAIRAPWPSRSAIEPAAPPPIVRHPLLAALVLTRALPSRRYGHSQISLPGRVGLCVAVSLSLIAFVRYARLTMKRLALPKEHRVSGAFSSLDDPITAHVGALHTPFEDATTDGSNLSSARPPQRPAAAATRLDEDEATPLTAESLDNAIASVGRLAGPSPGPPSANACARVVADGGTASAEVGGGSVGGRVTWQGSDGAAAEQQLEPDDDSDHEDRPLVEGHLHQRPRRTGAGYRAGAAARGRRGGALRARRPCAGRGALLVLEGAGSLCGPTALSQRGRCPEPTAREPDRLRPR